MWTRNPVPSAAWLGSLAMIVLAACTEAPPTIVSPPSPSFAAASTSWDVSADVAYSPEYQWTSGQPPVDMGTSLGSRVCLLTYVQGSLNSRVSYVRTYPLNKRWYLSGNSRQQPGLSARARCISVAWVGPEHVLAANGGPEVRLGMSSLPFVCGLTRVAGNWETGFESGYVNRGYPFPSGQWNLYAYGDDIEIGARCFGPLSTSSDGWFWNNGTLPTRLWDFATAFCFVNGLSGRFDAAQWVRVKPMRTNWYLVGASASGVRNARAECVR